MTDSSMTVWDLNVTQSSPGSNYNETTVDSFNCQIQHLDDAGNDTRIEVILHPQHLLLQQVWSQGAAPTTGFWKQQSQAYMGLNILFNGSHEKKPGMKPIQSSRCTLAPWFTTISTSKAAFDFARWQVFACIRCRACSAVPPLGWPRPAQMAFRPLQIPKGPMTSINIKTLGRLIYQKVIKNDWNIFVLFGSCCNYQAPFASSFWSISSRRGVEAERSCNSNSLIASVWVLKQIHNHLAICNPSPCQGTPRPLLLARITTDPGVASRVQSLYVQLWK